MYDPVKDGVAKTVESVVYDEAAPPAALRELVHCFWELRTLTDLDEDFTLHAMPDACVNLLFNLHDPRIAGVTRLHTTHTTLDLGRSFHYAGVQLFPGVWRGDPDALADDYVGEPYRGRSWLVRHRSKFQRRRWKDVTASVLGATRGPQFRRRLPSEWVVCRASMQPCDTDWTSTPHVPVAGADPLVMRGRGTRAPHAA